MRVLITVGYLGRYGETDGVVTTYRNLLPHFARSGHKVDVVAYGPEDRVEETGGVRLFVHRPRLPLRIDSVRRADAAFAWTSLGRALARVPYTLVQSSTPDPLGLWARSVARRRGCPFIPIYHTALAEYVAIRATRAAGPLVGKTLGSAMEQWLRHYFNAGDLILAPSGSVRDELAGRYRPAVDVLSRGVDGTAFNPAQRTRVGGRPRALYVGRLAPEKNLDLLVRLFRDRTDVELVVVGSGPSLASLKEQLPHALFAGRLDGQALAAEYADADFFVFPSRTDTLGNVVLEAMSSGLPAIVADSMGPKELVQRGVTGFVARTDEEFGGAVDLLAGDVEQRLRMGAAARRFAETRTWAAVFERLLSLYDRVLRTRAAAEVTPAPGGSGHVAVRQVAQQRERGLCVLDITEFFGATSGGVKTYLAQKAEYVRAHTGLRQVVVVPGAEHCRVEEGPVRRYFVRGPGVPTQRPYRLMIDAPAIRRIIERERPDIIEVGSHFIAPWIVSGVVRDTGIPAVWFCHSNLPRILAPYPEKASWARRRVAELSRRYMRRVGRLCSATLAPSDAMADDLAGVGLSNVVRVSLGVDVQCFDSARRVRRDETLQRLGLPDAPLLLYAGRITAEKGVDLLLDAWARIERETDAHLVLVGDGPDLERLRARHERGRIRWLPYEASRERLADLMAAAALYVAPSVVETFGLAAMEAMACDTPVLSADEGAVADHVRRSGAGELFVSGSATRLAERAVELLRAGLPEREARGRTYVTRHFSWSAAFDRIFAVYGQVLHAAASA